MRKDLLSERKESVERFQLDRLKQFYTDWYRPDLMAVIAVGDFDQPAIENLIKEHFSSIPGRASPRPRQEYPVPDVPGTLIDFGITRMPPPLVAVVEVFEKAPRRETSTVAAYRGDVVDALAARMLLARLTEIQPETRRPVRLRQRRAHTTRGCESRNGDSRDVERGARRRRAGQPVDGDREGGALRIHAK